jgi:hypothetical protein
MISSRVRTYPYSIEINTVATFDYTNLAGVRCGV